MLLDFYVVSFILVASLILINYIIGNYFSYIIGFRAKNVFLDVFMSNLLGCVILVSAWAIFQVHFKTIFILSIPLLVCLVFLSKSDRIYIERTQEQRFSLAYFLIFSITLSTTVFVYLNNYYDSSSILNIKRINEDQFYYSQLARYLTIAKEENTYTILNIILPETYNGTTLYHYFTPWLVNIINSVSHYPSYFNLLVVADSYFLFLTGTAILGLVHLYFSKINFVWIGFLLPVLLFFGGFYVEFYNELRILPTFHFTFSGFGYSKLVIFYLFYFGALVALLHQHRLLVLYLMLTLCIAYSQALPSVLVTLFIFSTFLLSKKVRSKTIGWQHLILFFYVFVIFLFLHVALSKQPEVAKYFNPYSLSFVFENFNLDQDFRTMLNIILGTSINVFLLYLPLIIFLFYKIRQVLGYSELKFLLIFAFVFGVSSISTWAFFFKDANSVQLFMNVLPPFMNVFFFFMILKLASNASFYFRAILASVVLLICSSNFIHVKAYLNPVSITEETKSFYKKLTKYVHVLGGKNHKGVVLLGKEDFQNRVSVYQYYLPGDFLTLYSQEIQLVSLSDYYIRGSFTNKMDSLRNEAGYQEAFFHHYLDIKMKEANYSHKHITKTHWKHQFQYIKENDISFAVLSKHYPYRDSIMCNSKKRFISPEGDDYVIF